jgi:hypothetical protein
VIRALRRWRIRRLYNAGHWSKARQKCKVEMAGPNRDFAAELIVRCLYNENLWRDLLDFAKSHPGADRGDYVHNARRKIAEEIEAAEGIPEPEQKNEWNHKDLLSNWLQEGNRLWLRHPWGWVHWDMPEGYMLNNTHPALLHLALEVLLSPWVPETKNWDAGVRVAGKHHSLSYSGGIDSTAAMILMPENTILAYHQRNFTSTLNHSLPHSTFECIKERTNRDVLCIPSNHEKIRTFHQKQTGFSTDHAAGVHLILLGDFLDLSGIAFGTPIDNTWLKKGLNYRDFKNSDYWEKWSKKFHDAGLSYDLVINHLSEGATLKVCRNSKFHDIVNSCLRGIGARWCGKCWKCFHKNGPLGRTFDANSNEIVTFLNTAPLRSGFHALWAVKNQHLDHLAPRLRAHLNQDFSWWDKGYLPGLNLINPALRTIIKENTEKYIEWMPQPYQLERTHIDV